MGGRVFQHSTDHLAAPPEGGRGTLAEHRRRLDTHDAPACIRGRAQKGTGSAADV
jgi:hypothetical protein